jgi:glycosyltransferase involved in cell wall biosynthesis
VPSPPVSIAIPAFNEIESLGGVVGEAVAVLRDLELTGSEVLVVDDGSTDGTGALSDELAAEDGGVIVRAVHHGRNQGFSGAIRTALREARGDLVLLIPADGQVEASVLRIFLPEIADVDCVVGVRRRRADPVYRRVLSWGFHTLSRSLLGLPLQEFSSSFLFRREMLQGLKMSSRAHSGTVLPEILARAHRRGARFREVVIPHHPRRAGEAKGAGLAVMLLSTIELVRLAISIRRDHPGG